MPNMIRGPLREVRSRYFDSKGWDDYQPRDDDIIIATYPKCGTTWTQRIVGMMVFQSTEPFPVQDISPWPDFRMAPPGEMLALASSQAHRRFFKSHLPYDALPIYEGVKIIHVARDGRDAAMSFHHHKINYEPQMLEIMDEMNTADPKFGTPLPRTNPDLSVHFHDWLMGDEDHIGDPGAGFWHMENSFWSARNEPDLLLVHFADMKSDLGGEMRRIADFLEIQIAEELWPDLIEAAGFDSMKSKASELLPGADTIWQGGGNTFLNKGTNGRWQGVVSPEDLDLYSQRVKEEFSPELAHWIEFGRLGASD